MAKILSTLSIVAFAVAAVCLVLAAFFWFFFKIPTVIGDLSGRTARKSIAKLRAANEKTGNKSHKESKVNVARGKLTEGIPTAQQAPQSGQVETSLLDENRIAAMASQETMPLYGNATMPLNTTTTAPTVQPEGVPLVMLDEIILIHTDEVIQ